MKRERLGSVIVLDDNTPIQKLSIKDQLRLLVFKLSKSDREELKAVNAEESYKLQLEADLYSFIEQATKTLRSGQHHSVTMSVNAKFLPVLDTVLKSFPYYTATTLIPDVDYDVEYFFKLTLEVQNT